MRLHVVQYTREADYEQTAEAFLSKRSANMRPKELDADSAEHEIADCYQYFSIEPRLDTINIPCNCEGLVAAIEGRWRKFVEVKP